MRRPPPAVAPLHRTAAAALAAQAPAAGNKRLNSCPKQVAKTVAQRRTLQKAHLPKNGGSCKEYTSAFPAHRIAYAVLGYLYHTSLVAAYLGAALEARQRQTQGRRQVPEATTSGPAAAGGRAAARRHRSALLQRSRCAIRWRGVVQSIVERDYRHADVMLSCAAQMRGFV